LVSQLSRAMTRVSDAQRRVGNELGLLENGPAPYEDREVFVPQCPAWPSVLTRAWPDTSDPATRPPKRG
jgi:hypothetical protein